jgi:hypothetical protein
MEEWRGLAESLPCGKERQPRAGWALGLFGGSHATPIGGNRSSYGFSIIKLCSDDIVSYAPNARRGDS